MHENYIVNKVETSNFTQLKICYLMTTFPCLSVILITSWLFTARWSTWPGNHLVPCVAELVRSCTSVSSWTKVPLLSIWSVAVPLCRPLLPCPSRWHGSLPLHGLWWLTCELHCSSFPWRLGSVYQLWKSPLLSCVPWSSDQTSCLSLQHNSWSSSCKGHNRSIRSSLHPWPCPSDERQSYTFDSCV